MWNNWKRWLHFNKCFKFSLNGCTTAIKGSPAFCHSKPTPQVERGANSSEMHQHARFHCLCNTRRSRARPVAYAPIFNFTWTLLGGSKVHTRYRIIQVRVELLCQNSMREWFAYFLDRHTLKGNRAGSRPTFERFAYHHAPFHCYLIRSTRDLHQRLMTYHANGQDALLFVCIVLCLRHFHTHAYTKVYRTGIFV